MIRKSRIAPTNLVGQTCRFAPPDLPDHGKLRPQLAGVAAAVVSLFLILIGQAALAEVVSSVNGPRIVNIYCFCRENDFRLENSQKILFQATLHQLQLIKQTHLPATFALQYDALMDPNYQKLFKEDLPTNCEIGAWWEIPQALTERAGLKW